MVGEAGHSDGCVQLGVEGRRSGSFLSPRSTGRRNWSRSPSTENFLPSTASSIQSPFDQRRTVIVVPLIPPVACARLRNSDGLEPLQISPMRLASVPNDAETARVPACEALRVHCGQICHGIRPPRRQYQTSSPGTPLCNLRQAFSNRPPGQVPPRSHILSGPHKPGELVQGFATANVGLQLMRQRCALCSDGPRNGQHPWVTFRGPQINLGRKGSPSGLGMVHDPTTASCLDCER